ncbi:hypothetical protein [Thiorhodovibrio frisius]|uniref:hypothetical protein n=1 Tax=Thiorhodovibrio frisius TaxID=631362 RepID=UPI000255DD3A|nr:hypothetical protein [Thiorhodovibrio frisius]
MKSEPTSVTSALGEALIERLATALQGDRACLSADVAALRDLSLIEQTADGVVNSPAPSPTRQNR